MHTSSIFPAKYFERFLSIFVMSFSIGVFIISRGYSQVLTPVPYNFPNQAGSHPLSFGLVAKTLPQSSQGLNNKYNFVCSASNGYGQWVANQAGHWMLLGNSLSDPDLGQNIPSGIIAEGNFTGGDVYSPTTAPAEIKVATNLKGSVRYVWPMEDRTGFIVQGFDAGQIDISAATFPLGNSRNIISSTIHTYPVVLTNFQGTLTKILLPVVNALPDWRDLWDICMDEDHLYIVWMGNDFKIYITVADMNDGIHWPKKSPVAGQRPSIACNIRHSGSTTCDVATISQVMPLWFNQTTPPFPGRVDHLFVADENSAIIQTPQPQFLIPPTVNQTPLPYNLPMHARMVVSSVPGLEHPIKGIYVLVDGGETHQTAAKDLILHYIFNDHDVDPIGAARYVDGVLNLNHDQPIPSGRGFQILNQPLTAFANPYDGNGLMNLPEFHCLYQLYLDDRNPIRYPLLIARANNAVIANLSAKFVFPSWTLMADPDLTTVYQDNTDVPLLNLAAFTTVASVNQMGVHVHWKEKGTNAPTFNNGLHWYDRDKRTFDEDITENTLATYDCYVADGAGHGSSVPGAILQPGKRLTLWTDPNFGVASATQSSGVYIANILNPKSWQNARLTLLDVNVTLDIGPEQSTGATLVALPNFEFQFTKSGQSLIIHRASVFDYYGFPQGAVSNPNGPAITNFLASSGITGTVELRGGGYSYTNGGEHDPPDALIAPAKLNVHGGANFKLPENITLLSNSSTINCLFEPSIIPIWSSPNGNATGVMNIHGAATINTSYVHTQIPSGVTDVFNFRSCTNSSPFSCSSVASQLSASNSLFINDGAGFARLRITGLAEHLDFGNPSAQSIEGGKFDGVGILAQAPTNTITIENATFENIRTRGIDLKPTAPDGTFSGYNKITIKNCDFGTFTANAEGIHTEDFTTTADFKNIWIQGNTFYRSTGLSGSDHVHAAIHLVNSCGTVLNNYITGSGYTNGIINESPITDTKTNTFFCSNNISFCSQGNGLTDFGAGLTTKNWNGYSKLNEIQHCDIGHLLQDNDAGSLVFCHYHENNGPGLKLSVHTASTDLSGVHHIPPSIDPDYAGWNTIDHNVLNGGTTGEIELNSAPSITLGTNAANSANFGHNTFIANGNTTSNPNFFIMYATQFTQLDGLNENFWGIGTWNNLTALTLTNYTDPTHLAAIQWLTMPNPTCHATPYLLDFYVDCGGGFTESIRGNDEPKIMSAEADTTVDVCTRLKTNGHFLAQGSQWKQANDTLRLYIEKCANQPGSDHAFAELDGAVGFMSDDNNRWLDYRDWLKKVLYLNLDTFYYCADVNSILTTFSYLIPEHGKDYNGSIAVIDFLLQNNKCPDAQLNLLEGRKYLRDKQVEIWRDTVHDSTKTPLDTSVVTLESLDLQILKGPEFGVVPSPASHVGNAIISFVATKNPFNDGTVVRYELEDASALRLEIYDELGRQVYSEREGIQESGQHEIQLSGKLFSEGTYFARLSTLSGEVRTITLKHF